MSPLLQPSRLDSEFGYRVELNGDHYIAGASSCHQISGAIFGDLSLEKLGTRDVRIWKPRLTNPFASEKRTEETRNLELYLENMMLAHSVCTYYPQVGLARFTDRLEKKIQEEYEARIERADLIKLFGAIHQHYLDYF